MQFSSKMTTWSFSSANPFLERQKLCPHPYCTSDPVSLSAEDVGEPEIAPQRLLSLLLTAPAYTSAALSVLLTFENKSLITQNVLYEVGARRCWPYIRAWNSSALNSATLLLQPTTPAALSSLSPGFVTLQFWFKVIHNTYQHPVWKASANSLLTTVQICTRLSPRLREESEESTQKTTFLKTANW